jgi:hypothetical protein
MADLLHSENNTSEVMALLSSVSHPRINGATQQPKNMQYTDSERYHCSSPDIIESPKPFASRCMEYFRAYTVDVIRSSLAQGREGRRQIFPSLRQVYRWILLLLLLIIDVQEEDELPETPQFFTRPQESLPVHRPMQSREKTAMDKPPRNLPAPQLTSKHETDTYRKNVNHDSTNHSSTYDDLIAETDSLAIELKDDNTTQDFTKTFIAAHDKTNRNAISLQPGNADSYTSPPQIPPHPCLSPKTSVRMIENHVVPSHALPTFHNNADPRRHEAENCSSTLNYAPRARSSRIAHRSSSPDLRRQKSPVHTDAEGFRHVHPRKYDSTNTTSSSNSSSSGKRPSIPRGPGVQLIQGKTIGEILHANPLIRKDDTSLVLAPWRS